MDVLSKLRFKGSGAVLENGVSFPQDPEDGQLCLVSGVVYIYTTLSGFATWYPLSNESAYFVHTQGLASTTWLIQHDLDTTDFIFFVYDENNNLIQPIYNSVDRNSFELQFTQARKGKVVVFVAAERYSPRVSTTNLVTKNLISEDTGETVFSFEANGDISFNGNLIPTQNEVFSIGSVNSKIKDLFVSANTIHLGENTTIEGTSISVNGGSNPTTLAEIPTLIGSKLVARPFTYAPAVGTSVTVNPSIEFQNDLGQSFPISFVSTPGSEKFSFDSPTGVGQATLVAKAVETSGITLAGYDFSETDFKVDGNIRVDGNVVLGYDNAQTITFKSPVIAQSSILLQNGATIGDGNDDVTLNAGAANTIYFQGKTDFGGNKIKNIGTPTLGSDAVTKDHLDNEITQVMGSLSSSNVTIGEIQTELDLKAPIASPTFTGTVSGISKSMVGLGLVDNTSDIDKPISTANQSALNLKAPIASPTFTGTVSGISKSMVGLDSVDNTSDTDKPISTATQSALNLKSNISSIVDSLTSTAINQPLSANQGKVLKGLIDSINSLLQSDNTTLNELQEIVNYIELNRSTLDALSISSIAGLQAALDLKLNANANAVSASKLLTARTVTLSGSVTGSTSFDGSGNVAIATTATSDPTLTLTGDVTGSATFTNLGNATLTAVVANDSHTHDGRYYTETESDARYLGISAKAADANLLDGYNSASTATASTITLRDGAADIQARLFRSNYAEQTSAAATTADICFRNDSASDNYMRFMNSTAFKSYCDAIGISVDGHTHSYLGLTAKAADSNLLDGINSTTFFRKDQSNLPTTTNTYDIGSSTATFRYMHATTFYGTSTSAQLADLAEMYTCKDKLPVGTIVTIPESEDFDVEICDIYAVPFGVVSDKPGFLLDNDLEGLPVALAGKTPVLVKGPIKKGQPIVMVADGVAGAGTFNDDFVLGRALQTVQQGSESISLVKCYVKSI